MSTKREKHEVTDGEANEWQATLEDLAERRRAARAMGGEERLVKHRAAGELDARARTHGARAGADERSA